MSDYSKINDAFAEHCRSQGLPTYMDLLTKLDEAEQTLVELKPDPTLVEGSWFPTNELPKILGNFMRSSDEYAREAKAEMMRREAAEQRERDLIAGIRKVTDSAREGLADCDDDFEMSSLWVLETLAPLLPTPTEEGTK